MKRQIFKFIIQLKTLEGKLLISMYRFLRRASCEANGRLCSIGFHPSSCTKKLYDIIESNEVSDATDDKNNTSSMKRRWDKIH